ncbi:hypothetical protein [Pontibacter vulgaris]|uniref:hypothetical protein n=1 Tax=Pontibacter vulgaris TaxID=2905679 RepID=UPI001FA713E5|nr:hypothetical protein [Pontibacter vulgaris]
MRNHLLQFIFILCILLSTGCARKNFFTETPLTDTALHDQLHNKNSNTLDSVNIRAGEHYKRGFFHNLFWGKHYSAVWAAPVTVPVFRLEKEYGGLKIEKLGGGFQTTSITLSDKDGFMYAMRSLDKDPVSVLPTIWRKTFVANIIRNQTSAINPYGALVIPPMATAAKLPHSTPKVVYVQPNDSSFGEHTERFSDRVFMIENKFDDDGAVPESLGNAKAIVNSNKMLNKRFEKNTHHIDQQAFAKARLFDLFLNDWDRHEGQWEWAEYEEGEETIYRPIAKDRDNAFFKFNDGILTWLFSRNWAIRKFETFDEKYKDVYALAMNSKFIDERALSEVTAEDFQKLAKELQTALTDEVIEKAIRQFPDSVYALVGKDTEQKLKSRRDKLPEAAQEFYRILAKEPIIVGTDQEEKFEVKRLNDDETRVIVIRSDDKKKIYERTFNRAETQLITLYGLAEGDKFEVSGEVNKGITVAIVGGRGEDEIKDTSRVKSPGKQTIVYDTKRGTEIKGSKETKDKTGHDVRVHAFDREGF